MSASFGKDGDSDAAVSDRCADAVVGLQRFCRCLVRFMSTIAMDPHLYFEQKVSAQIAAVSTHDEARKLTNWVINWLETTDLSSEQRARIDALLAADDLPTLSLMRDPANRELGGILASGVAATTGEYLLLQACDAGEEELPAQDAQLAARLVSEHVSRG